MADQCNVILLHAGLQTVIVSLTCTWLDESQRHAAHQQMKAMHCQSDETEEMLAGYRVANMPFLQCVGMNELFRTHDIL